MTAARAAFLALWIATTNLVAGRGFEAPPSDWGGGGLMFSGGCGLAADAIYANGLGGGSADGVTFECWVRPDATNGTMALFGRGAGPRGLDLALADGCRIEASLAVAGARVLRLDAPLAYPAGRWFHLALTLSSNAFVYHVNGREQHRGTVAAGVEDFLSARILWIGGAGRAGAGWRGGIGPLVAWYGARSGAEITACWHRSWSGLESTPCPQLDPRAPLGPDALAISALLVWSEGRGSTAREWRSQGDLTLSADITWLAAGAWGTPLPRLAGTAAGPADRDFAAARTGRSRWPLTGAAWRAPLRRWVHAGEPAVAPVRKRGAGAISGLRLDLVGYAWATAGRMGWGFAGDP